MRYELKYKLDHFSLSAIEQAIKAHPAGFRKIFPDRRVNNIYFDTLGLTTYRDNVVGIADRKKFRVRWYGSQGVVNPRLEIKIKQNMLGTKKIFNLEDFSLDGLDELNIKVNQLVGQQGVLRPVLMNTYERSYFGTSDQNFRLTVDRKMTYTSLITSTSGQYLQPSKEKGYILELKYEQVMDGHTDRITQFFPYRQTKSSKYVKGVVLCHG